ncbi:MAG: hypothetical protein VKK62_04120 [Synechococcaceae cyanobacterium]|nr:hypothetical protein [Synechococcaceae cyanobacterium]
MTHSHPLLVRWYGGLAIIAVAVTVKALIWPRWPSAAPLDRGAISTALSTAGIAATPLPDKPATRTYDLASSPLLAWRLANGDELRLMRSSSRERSNLNAAFLARAQPTLPLKQRQQVSTPVDGAVGRNEGRQARLTCLMPLPTGQPGFALTHVQMETLLSNNPAPRASRLREVFGLTPSTGYSCVLIGLRGARSSSPLPDAGSWKRLLNALAPVFHSQARRTPAGTTPEATSAGPG